MRWRPYQGGFGPGFGPGFPSGGAGVDYGADEDGVRTIQLHMRPEGQVNNLPIAIDPDGLTCDVWVICNEPAVGYVRMRKAGTNTWYPLTESPGTSFHLPGLNGSAVNVEIEVTVPGRDVNGYMLEPEDFYLQVYWDQFPA